MTVATTSGSFILFTVAGTTYALRSTDVAHVEMIDEITGVPNAPPFVDGVVFSRGHVVPAVNLRTRFGFEKAPFDVATRLLVVRASEDRLVGLIVDAAREFTALDAAAIQPPGTALSGVSGRYLEGVANVNGRLILFLDLSAVLDIEPRALETR